MQVHIEDPTVREAVRTIAEAVRRAGGRAWIVGGAVRDAALGMAVREIDFEVYGLSAERLRQVVAAHFPVDLIGQAFGILKLRGLPIDISLPRRETKVGSGHRGFLIKSDPFLSYRESSQRRDFTINSAAWDPLTGEVCDPWGGCADLRRRVLRHTSAKFVEDPLRVLRGMQLIARFELTPAEETIRLCRSMDAEGLTPERVFLEWKKLLLWGRRPSGGLSFLAACRWLRYFPELAALRGVPQEPQWHPEGDVWTHTLLAVDAFAGERIQDEWEDLVVGFAVLCHDFGKPHTTRHEGGRIRSLGHEKAGEEPTRTFLRRMTRHKELIESVVPLVANHMRPQELHQRQASEAAIRRLARRAGRIDRLVRVARADQKARPGLPFDGFPAGTWLLAKAEELAVKDSAPQPLVKGRHLIALGLTPGPHFGPILQACYEAQLDGLFTDLSEGIAFAKRYIESAGGSLRGKGEPNGRTSDPQH